ncbi:hypothetical protein AJ87_08365 [Rhizobium yanglingense]|nr:hypothetical protein AJ87_08365 [Rhizobium yanglingense]
MASAQVIPLLMAIERGGSGSALNYATYRLSDVSVTAGPSVRMIIDVGNWDESFFVMTWTIRRSGFATLCRSDLKLDSGGIQTLYSTTKVDEATAKRTKDCFGVPLWASYQAQHFPTI